MSQRRCGSCQKVFRTRYYTMRHQMAKGTPCKDATENLCDQATVRIRYFIARRAFEKTGVLSPLHRCYKRRLRQCRFANCTGRFSKAAMALHLKHKHDSTKCIPCGKMFGSAASMRRHRHERHGIIVESCPKCGITPKRMAEHKKYCNGMTTKEFKCASVSCVSAFTRLRNLTAHVARCHSEPTPTKKRAGESCLAGVTSI